MNFLQNKLPHILTYCREKGVFPYQSFYEILKSVLFLAKSEPNVNEIIMVCMGEPAKKETKYDEILEMVG